MSDEFRDDEAEDYLSQVPLDDFGNIKKEEQEQDEFSDPKAEEVFSQISEEGMAMYTLRAEKKETAETVQCKKEEAPSLTEPLRLSRNTVPNPRPAIKPKPARFDDDFKQFAMSQDLVPGTQPYRKAKAEMLKTEIMQHFFDIVAEKDGQGRTIDQYQRRLLGWHNILTIVRKKIPTPDTVFECKAELHRPPFVNIIDLVDAARQSTRPPRFTNWETFKMYTNRPGKTIPIGEAREHEALECFLHNFRMGPDVIQPFFLKRSQLYRGEAWDDKYNCHQTKDSGSPAPQSPSAASSHLGQKRSIDEEEDSPKRIKIEDLGAVLRNDNIAVSQRIEDICDAEFGYESNDEGDKNSSDESAPGSVGSDSEESSI